MTRVKKGGVWHDNEHSCVCVCVYIYIYIWMCVWVSMCGQWLVESSSTSLKWHQNVQIFLCLFWRKDHTKSYDHKNLGDQKRRTKDISQLRVGLQSSQCGAEGQSNRSETPDQRVSQSRVFCSSKSMFVFPSTCCLLFFTSHLTKTESMGIRNFKKDWNIESYS